MKLHKLAEYFPILEGEEFDLLVEDIEKNGQLEPIVMVGDEILDGVNRYRACEELSIPPWTEEYDGNDPLSYVISLNIRRRHLDTSQRAMLATEMLPEFEKEAAQRELEGKRRGGLAKHGRDAGGKVDPQADKWGKHRSRDDAAKQFGVSGLSVQQAKRIKNEAPERVENIIRGEETVRAVDSELRQVKAKERAAVKQEKADVKEVKQHPKCVKEYLVSSQQYKDALKLAIKCARRDLFAPEAMQFIENRHKQIRELMSELEEIE